MIIIDEILELTHGELLASAEEWGFRFDVWSVPGDGPGQTEEGVTIHEPRYKGKRRIGRRALMREICARMYRRGLRDFLILRELAKRPVSTAGYDAM